MAISRLILRSGVGPVSSIPYMLTRGLGLFDIAVFMGLSYTKPTLDGHNIHEPTWSSYMRVAVGLGSDDRGYHNVTSVVFPVAIIQPNVYQELPYFVLYDKFGNFVGAGSVNPYATLTQNALLTFNAGDIHFVRGTVSYIPNITNTAFPTITYPPFTPTYEPYILGVPIVYGLNMRS